MGDSLASLKQLFTVGHSDHELQAFIKLLRRNDIDAVVDVRSVPFSQRSPQFNRDVLEQFLPAQQIHYSFLGEELGARRAEAECYFGGKARYDLIRKTPLFREGIARMVEAASSQRVALMCAESDPITCHRSILICREVRQSFAAIQHILPSGRLESQMESERRLLRLFNLDDGDLFQDVAALIENAYDQQGERIAYVVRTGDGRRFAPKELTDDDQTIHDWVHQEDCGDVFRSPP